MAIRQVTTSDFEVVKNITHETINTIYPHYYPKGAVDFFIAHHNDENILNDISKGACFLLENKNKAIGTVTINDFEINRLFVMPAYQGYGYGSALLDFSEQFVAKSFDRVELSASLPAKEMYFKRGYQEISSHSIKTADNDYLCYDLMRKNVRPSICGGLP